MHSPALTKAAALLWACLAVVQGLPQDYAVASDPTVPSGAADVDTAALESLVSTSSATQKGLLPSLCCAALSLALGKKVSYPSDSSYSSSLASYWSLQESALSPSCIVSPQSKVDVVLTVKTLRVLDVLGISCKFAIRGGGHTPFSGSANIQSGITIDMRKIKDVTINKKTKVAAIGAGAAWGDVYRAADAQNLAVVGGRGASIGVGGLVTGGGISFFSPRKGFACDNVVNFEVVLASGELVNANAKENPDLWVALRGGSNNFGIVTRFDLQAFDQGKFWGGQILYGPEAIPSLLEAFNGINKKTYDEYAALIMGFSWVSTMGGFVATATIQYTKPVENPPAFQPFTVAQPQYTNSMRISNHTDFVTEFVANQGAGRKQLYITSTFTQNDDFIRAAYNYFAAVSKSPVANVPNFYAALVLQPISIDLIKKSAQAGGNSLGIGSNEGPLVLALLSFTWDSSSDDAAMKQVAQGIHANIVAEAKKRGLYNDWVYLNYAANFQDPITGYGATNKAKLQAVSRKYDPKGVFQKLVPGGFKLFV